MTGLHFFKLKILKMQSNLFIWLVPVASVIALLYAGTELYLFYRSLRRLPWQIWADRHRKQRGTTMFDQHVIPRELTDYSFADCVGLIESAYMMYEQKKWHTRLVDRLRTIATSLWVVVIFLTLVLFTLMALHSCGISRYPYGKSYYQNNPACASQRP
jgi:hypothetical protein